MTKIKCRVWGRIGEASSYSPSSYSPRSSAFATKPTSTTSHSPPHSITKRHCRAEKSNSNRQGEKYGRRAALLSSIWPETVATATHPTNVNPSRANNRSSPIKIYTGKSVDLRRLRVYVQLTWEKSPEARLTQMSKSALSLGTTTKPKVIASTTLRRRFSWKQMFDLTSEACRLHTPCSHHDLLATRYHHINNPLEFLDKTNKPTHAQKDPSPDHQIDLPPCGEDDVANTHSPAQLAPPPRPYEDSPPRVGQRRQRTMTTTTPTRASLMMWGGTLLFKRLHLFDGGYLWTNRLAQNLPTSRLASKDAERVRITCTYWQMVLGLRYQ